MVYFVQTIQLLMTVQLNAMKRLERYCVLHTRRPWDANQGQCVLLVPKILMGISVPVIPCAQRNAHRRKCYALTVWTQKDAEMLIFVYREVKIKMAFFVLNYAHRSAQMLNTFAQDYLKATDVQDQRNA